MKKIVLFVFLLSSSMLLAQDLLPPAQPWNGKSTSLIRSNHQWVTHAEKNEFRTTPSYRETYQWLKQLTDAVPEMRMISIGKSLQGRDIIMVIASADRKFTANDLAISSKPLLLIQGGIHAGEIDGKDAGMMLLRDIAFGGKKNLLSKVNIIFVPILNVDGHERSSPYNRVNQRGPENMGWRTNARNYNLNRDYAKLDSDEIRSIARVINDYQPDLYLDIHVTDGADYQYDITYGYSENYSPAIAGWLDEKLKPVVDRDLDAWDHIPGPLVFAENNIDFTDGMTEFPYSPRLSNGYGDARHLPTILVENHSLKPFRQRVLGTYVFLEAVIRVLASDGQSLIAAVKKDRDDRRKNVVLSWKRSAKVDTITFRGIRSDRRTSSITGKQFVEWTAEPVLQRIPYYRFSEPDKVAERPKAFWVPSTYPDIIERLRIHGITMEDVKTERLVKARFLKVGEHTISPRPTEGHFTVRAQFTPQDRDELFYAGSVRVPLDQPLGDLAMLLLHPESADSFFQWGFFPEIFSRTEYMEQYVAEPLARKMLDSDRALSDEFNERKSSDSVFAANPYRVYEWFYERSPWIDRQWMIYPVAMEY